MSFWGLKTPPRGGYPDWPGGTGSAVVAGKGQVNMYKFKLRDLLVLTPWFALVLIVSFNIKEIAGLIF